MKKEKMTMIFKCGILLILCWSGIGSAAFGDSVKLVESFEFPGNYSRDSVNYAVTIQSHANPSGKAPTVRPGNYTFNFGIFGTRNITVNGDGTIQDSTYYGGPAVISADGLSITFTNGTSIDVDPDIYANGNQPPNFNQDNTTPNNFTLYGPLNNLLAEHDNSISYEFYHTAVLTIYGTSYYETYNFGTGSGFSRPAQTFNRTDKFDLSGEADNSPPTNPNGGNPPDPKKKKPNPQDTPACSGQPGGSHCMATYAFDMSRAALEVNDIPISYTPPRGPQIVFSTTYQQADLGQLTTPAFANLGPQWNYNFLTYISNSPDGGGGTVTRYVSGGGLEYYPNFNIAPYGGVPRNDGSFGYYCSSDPERESRAVLSWDPVNYRYTRSLPDGSYQIYDHKFTDSTGTTDYLITSEADAQGNVVNYAYDGQNRLISVTDAIGQVTTLSYSLASDPLKITQVTDPFGRAVKFTYDSQGRLQSATDPQGIVSRYGYDSTNFLNQLTTPYGTSTFTTESDAEHHAVNATNPLLQTERVELRYNSAGIADSDTAVPSAPGLITQNFGLNQNTTFYWDRRQYPSYPDYTKAHAMHWMNGSHGLTPIMDSEKQPLENRVWFTYQGQTQPDILPDNAVCAPAVTARVLDDGTTQANFTSYTSTSLIIQTIDPLGRTTNLAYAANGIDLVQISQKNGSGTDLLSTMTYDNQHNVLTMTDAAGQTTTNTYNGYGQLVTSTDPKNETTTLAYNTDSTLATVTAPASGATTTFTYDAVKRVQTMTDSEGYTLTFAYDNLDRQIKTTYPDGTSDQTIYGAPTSTSPLDVVQMIDRQNRSTTMTYDAIRELLTTTDPLQRTTTNTWCTCGGLATLTDSKGNVTTWSRDLEGRATAKIFADGTQVAYNYENTTSRMHEMTDANGSTMTYAYDLDNKQISKAYVLGSGVSATPNVSYTYDPVYDRVTTMTDGTGTTTYTYNPVNGQLGANQLANVSVPVEKTGQQAVTTYQYDELGRVINQNIDENNSSGVSFDSLGRTTSVTNLLGSSSYSYVHTTNRISLMKLPNWQQMSFSYYDNVGDQRLKEINNYVWGMINNTPLSDFQYTYNPVGTIATWQQQTDGNQAYVETLSYDSADQLTNAVKTTSAIATTVSNNAYTYDAAGNRLKEQTLGFLNTGAFNNLNQLITYSAQGAVAFTGKVSKPSTVTVNGQTASIDSQNNFSATLFLPGGPNTVSVIAQDPTGDIRTNKYQVTGSSAAPYALLYDKNGNTLQDEKGNVYVWDAENRLISITYATGAKSLFAYDGSDRRVQIVEKDVSGTVMSTKNFVWCGSSMCEERNASNNVTKRFYSQGEQIAGVAYFFTRDHLGSVREMVDSSGTIHARYSYDPYGRTTLVSGSNLSDFQYAGYYAHQPSGLYLTKYRAYDPNTARWLSRDPIAESGGMNLYGYVGNEPVNRFDPMGLCDCRDPGPMVNQAAKNLGIQGRATLGSILGVQVSFSVSFSGISVSVGGGFVSGTSYSVGFGSNAYTGSAPVGEPVPSNYTNGFPVTYQNGVNGSAGGGLGSISPGGAVGLTYPMGDTGNDWYKPQCSPRVNGFVGTGGGTPSVAVTYATTFSLAW